MRELEVLHRGGQVGTVVDAQAPLLDPEYVEDLDDAPDAELEEKEEQVLDQATAARTIEELRIEIETLKRLEGLTLAIRRSGEDKKWRELATLLGEIFTSASLANVVAEEQAPYDAGARAAPRPAPSPLWSAIIHYAAIGAKEYSWCRPPSTGLPRIATPSGKPYRKFRFRHCGGATGGSGTPGPSAMCGRPPL